jgi:hypothetical protein
VPTPPKPTADPESHAASASARQLIALANELGQSATTGDATVIQGVQRRLQHWVTDAGAVQALAKLSTEVVPLLRDLQDAIADGMQIETRVQAIAQRLLKAGGHGA